MFIILHRYHFVVALLLMLFTSTAIAQNSMIKQDSQDSEAVTLYGEAIDLIKQKKDLEHAFILLQRASLLNFVPAYRAMGRMYEDGFGVEVNLQKALELYELAASKGDRTQFYLANMYHKGKNVPKNAKKALAYFIQAADKGHAESQLMVARLTTKDCYEKNDFSMAEHYLSLAAEQHLAEAQYLLGYLHMACINGPKSTQIAIRNYILAAEQDHDGAQTSLGILYLRGEGIKRNTKKAAQHFENAARQGNSEAVYMLAQMYHFGDYFEQDNFIAYTLILLAEFLGGSICEETAFTKAKADYAALLSTDEQVKAEVKAKAEAESMAAKFDGK